MDFKLMKSNVEKDDENSRKITFFDIFTRKQTDRQTDRHTHTQIDGQTHTQIDRRTGKQTKIKTNKQVSKQATGRQLDKRGDRQTTDRWTTDN